ncbi:MAG: pyridoxamine 5'-phosphate oxidase family protein [Ferruginibacter sp.]
MDEIINLTNEEASKKLKELTRAINICMFSTDIENAEGAITRPMAVQQTDTDNFLWFFSSKDSNKNKEISKNNFIQLYFSDPGKSTYVSITGNAEIVIDDKQKIEEMWNPLMKTWFQEGKDDPKISLIKVMPVDGYYWDSTGNRFTNFFKMIGSVVSGKDLVGSEEGSLKP